MINTFSRFEFKYPIHESRMQSLEHDLLALGASKDVGGCPYTVSSLYFDTPSFLDYNDKAGGFLERRKVRARIYAKTLAENNSGNVWLELKEKYDMTISKKRVAVTQDEWLLFSKTFFVPKSVYARFNEKEAKAMRAFCFQVNSFRRRPHLFVRYLRKPYTYTIGGHTMRVTLDYNLEATRTSELCPRKGVVRVMPRKAVMEVKYNNVLPPCMRWIFDKYNLRRDAYSKYALSFEAVRRFNPIGR